MSLAEGENTFNIADMEVLLLVDVTLFGMVLGSFLGLAVVRIPCGESLLSPRSHCRNCDHVLRWYENIPILSYLLLGGKCRRCRAPISIRYLIVETVTTGITVFAYLKIEPWPRFLLYLIFFILPMLLLMFLDWEALILPDAVTLPGVPAGFVLHWLDGRYFLPYQFGSSTQKLLMESLLGALAGSLCLFLLAWLYHRFRKREGLGGGDIKLAAMIGAFFGWKQVFFIFFLASVLGTLLGIFIILAKKGSKETPLPFGSFLAATSIVFLFYGDFLLSTYLSWFR